MTPRRNIALILIALCLVAGYGETAFYHIGREFIRESQIRRMARLEGDHVFERIPESDAILWVEKGREFILDGRMYDVVETRESDGSREFLVIPDDREKELIDRYHSKFGSDPTTTCYRNPEQNPCSGFWLSTDSFVESMQTCLGSTPIKPVSFSDLPSPPFIPVSVPPPLL